MSPLWAKRFGGQCFMASARGVDLHDLWNFAYHREILVNIKVRPLALWAYHK